MLGFSALFLFNCASQLTTEQELLWPDPPDKPRFKFDRLVYSTNIEGRSTINKLKAAVLGSDAVTELLQPFDVVVDSLGVIYVSDVGGSAIKVFDINSGKVRTIGKKGKGKLIAPASLTLSDDVLYVADSRAKKINGFSIRFLPHHEIRDLNSDERIKNPN